MRREPIVAMAAFFLRVPHLYPLYIGASPLEICPVLDAGRWPGVASRPGQLFDLVARQMLPHQHGGDSRHGPASIGMALAPAALLFGIGQRHESALFGYGITVTQGGDLVDRWSDDREANGAPSRRLRRRVADMRPRQRVEILLQLLGGEQRVTLAKKDIEVVR